MPQNNKSLYRIVVLTGVIGVSMVVGAPAVAQSPLVGHARFVSCDDSPVRGRATLFEQPSDQGVKNVVIVLSVKGLPDGDHAVHLHETGICDSCGDAGGHFDPGPNSNPGPDSNHPYHSGDLVNVRVKNGRGALHTSTSRVTLSPGPLSVFDADGSAFIIHVDPDTYCPDGEVGGCAGGARAACGIVRLR